MIMAIHDGNTDKISRMMRKGARRGALTR